MLILFFTLISITLVQDLPFNQPKFCSNRTWDPNGITVANLNTFAFTPLDIFITTNNSIYLSSLSQRYILFFTNPNSSFVNNISLNSIEVFSIFVTENNFIYYSAANGINKLSSDLTNETSVMNTCSVCYGIFIDIQKNIYCSLQYLHKVIRKSLTNHLDLVEIVGGTGSNGSTSYMLNGPYGIFVDTNFDLYVVDFYNNRIQLFSQGQFNATTVAGSTSIETTINLYQPVEIILDANKYLFIVDFGHNRIVGNGPNGFRCIIGCNGAGSSANQLNGPRSMSFDASGNIFVVDYYNKRVQKFLLASNSCSKHISLFILLERKTI